MDVFTPEERSRIMAKVHGKDTKPELIVRKLAFSLGFRFRVNAKALPGKPDLSIKSRKKAIFVHGCFWHRHEGCKLASTPVSNLEYWLSKFEGNMARDRKHLANYKAMGWKPLVIWECETRQIDKLRKRLKAYLSS